MKLIKSLILGIFIFLSLSIGSAYADTCYDPHYGNYVCNPDYNSYPDPGEVFMEGAVTGVFIGSAFNNNEYYNGGNWNRDRGRGHGYGGGRGGEHRGHHR